MRLRRSAMLMVLVGGVVVLFVLVATGISVATGSWLGGGLVGIGSALGLGVVGVAVSRVNDRLGEIRASQRRAAAQDRKRSAAEVTGKDRGQSAAKDSARRPKVDPGLVAMKELIALQKTPVGPGALADGGRRRFPIAELDLDEWKATRVTGTRPRLTVRAPSWGAGPLLNPAAVPVAMIADEFTYQSFAPEFEVHRLTPGNWRETFERVEPALFFCESAWSGGTPPERPWAGQIYATMAWPEERRRHLLEILAHCRRRGIPTVFWNKEDPIHFPDRRNDFVRTAGLFDLVLTTAEECIALYQRDAGSEHVGVLPFAVQPRIFHPRSGGDAADSAVFAGTWYERYPQRTAALSRILDLVTSSGRGLVIYDRQFNSPEGYRFPARYDVYRRPAISYEETARAYRDHLFGITLNTITDSHTMFARRVFEMAACGQVILSNTAVGVEAFFGDSVIYADREPERYLALNGAEMLRMRREALAAALNNTYAHRAVTVLEHLGMRPAPLDQPVTLVTAIRTEEDYAAACRHRNRGGVGDILCLVADNAEEGLLLSLSSRHEPGVAVELSRRVFSGEVRSRALIQTRSVLLGDVDRLPDETWIAKATPHLAYSDLPLIAGGTADVGVERVAASAGLYGSLMTAEMFDRFVCGGERLPALNALRG